MMQADFNTWLQIVGSTIGIGLFIAGAILGGFRMVGTKITELGKISSTQHAEVMGAIKTSVDTASQTATTTAELAKVLEKTQDTYQENLKMITSNHQETITKLLAPIQSAVAAAKKKERKPRG